MKYLTQVKFGKYVLYESMRNGVIFGALYGISGEHGDLLFFGFVLAVAGIIYDGRDYLQDVYKKLTINGANGALCWNGRGCDVDISGVGLWSSLKLTYMLGMNMRTVRIPSTVFSSDVWKQLTEYRT